MSVLTTMEACLKGTIIIMPKNEDAQLYSHPQYFSPFTAFFISFGKNIIWSILCYSVVPPVPASEKTRRHSSGMLKKAISKASNLSFLFLNTIPMPSKWKRKRMEIRHSGFYGLPRHSTSRHHRKQRRILYSIQEQQPLTLLEAMSCGVPWLLRS